MATTSSRIINQGAIAVFFSEFPDEDDHEKYYRYNIMAICMGSASTYNVPAVTAEQQIWVPFWFRATNGTYLASHADIEQMFKSTTFTYGDNTGRGFLYPTTLPSLPKDDSRRYILRLNAIITCWPERTIETMKEVATLSETICDRRCHELSLLGHLYAITISRDDDRNGIPYFECKWRRELNVDEMIRTIKSSRLYTSSDANCFPYSWYTLELSEATYEDPLNALDRWILTKVRVPSVNRRTGEKVEYEKFDNNEIIRG